VLLAFRTGVSSSALTGRMSGSQLSGLLDASKEEEQERVTSEWLNDNSKYHQAASSNLLCH
jgi:hypothetical protein